MINSWSEKWCRYLMRIFVEADQGLSLFFVGSRTRKKREISPSVTVGRGIRLISPMTHSNFSFSFAFALSSSPNFAGLFSVYVRILILYDFGRVSEESMIFEFLRLSISIRCTLNRIILASSIIPSQLWRLISDYSNNLCISLTIYATTHFMKQYFLTLKKKKLSMRRRNGTYFFETARISHVI